MFKENINKKSLTILWLDDQRDPYKYFKKKADPTNIAQTRIFNYYQNNIFNKYDVKFDWVKSYEEFVNYIIHNGIPKFISFDFDLKNARSNTDKKLPNGGDCAKWLINYCKEKGLKMPYCFAHTANKTQRPYLNTILGLNEKNELKEDKIKQIVTECINSFFKRKL